MWVNKKNVGKTFFIAINFLDKVLHGLKRETYDTWGSKTIDTINSQSTCTDKSNIYSITSDMG